ncbi:hypothetical protein Tco_0158056 [Tanacetum coccineum]
MSGPTRCASSTPELSRFQESQHDGLNMGHYEIDYKNGLDSILIQMHKGLLTLCITHNNCRQKRLVINHLLLLYADPEQDPPEQDNVQCAAARML